MMLPFVTPMPYGMAKWGWVNVDFPKGKFSPELAKEWIAESYRFTAPKRLLGGLLQSDPAPAVHRRGRAPPRRVGGRR